MCAATARAGSAAASAASNKPRRTSRSARFRRRSRRTPAAAPASQIRACHSRRHFISTGTERPAPRSAPPATAAIARRERLAGARLSGRLVRPPQRRIPGFPASRRHRAGLPPTRQIDRGFVGTVRHHGSAGIGATKRSSGAARRRAVTGKPGRAGRARLQPEPGTAAAPLPAPQPETPRRAAPAPRGRRDAVRRSFRATGGAAGRQRRQRLDPGGGPRSPAGAGRAARIRRARTLDEVFREFLRRKGRAGRARTRASPRSARGSSSIRRG